MRVDGGCVTHMDADEESSQVPASSAQTAGRLSSTASRHSMMQRFSLPRATWSERVWVKCGSGTREQRWSGAAVDGCWSRRYRQSTASSALHPWRVTLLDGLEARVGSRTRVSAEEFDSRLVVSRLLLLATNLLLLLLPSLKAIHSHHIPLSLCIPCLLLPCCCRRQTAPLAHPAASASCVRRSLAPT